MNESLLKGKSEIESPQKPGSLFVSPCFKQKFNNGLACPFGEGTPEGMKLDFMQERGTFE